MKEEISSRENLTILSCYIIDAFNSSSKKEKGSIRLDLEFRDEKILCYFVSDGDKLVFDFGCIKTYDVKLTASLYDWLELARGKLNPVWGAVTGKLKFEGDTKVFDRIIRKDLLYKIGVETADPPAEFELKPLKNWHPPEKVLVINGAPRGRNGYTYLYLNRFIKGMAGAGAVVETVDLCSANILPCAGCFHCWKNNTGKCVQQDDLNALYDRYYGSDLIIYAFPLYWDTVPGKLKNFIERAFCLEHPYMIAGLSKTRHPRRVKKEQSFFVFSVCGFPEQSHFNAVIEYFKAVSHGAHMPYLGGIYRTACMFLHNDPTFFKTYNLVLDSIQKAGESLYRSGVIGRMLEKAINTKVKPNDFRTSANKFWENIVVSKINRFVKSV